MSHAYHPGLPGYDEKHVLHDGCETCEKRAGGGLGGLLELDQATLRRLWDKMLSYEIRPITNLSSPGIASESDHQAMRTLYLLGVLLDSVTTLDPFGEGIPWKQVQS